MQKILQIDECKSYVSEKNLMSALKKLDAPYGSDRCLIVKNRDDRWTAIFSLDRSEGGYLGRYAQFGFMSV